MALTGIFGVYSYVDDPLKNGILIFSAAIDSGQSRAGDHASDGAFLAHAGLPETNALAVHRRALRG